MTADLIIIGILGKKRTGKDTIAQYLVKQHGYKQFYLAEPIYNIVYHGEDRLKEIVPAIEYQDLHKFRFLLNQIKKRDSYHVNRCYTTTTEDLKSIKEFRQILQLVGDMGRKISSDFWINKLLYKFYNYISETALNCYKVVISDIRLDTEIIALRNRATNDWLLGEGKFVLWKVNRSMTDEDTHVTEAQIDKLKPSIINHSIDNNGKIAALYSQVDLAVKLI